MWPMTLQQFLEERARQEDTEGARTSRIREEWKSSVSRLILKIEQWLRDADPDKILTLERETHRIREEKLGTYDVPGLLVRLGAREVRVVPIARFSIGSMVGDNLGVSLRFGRVDITDGSRKIMLYRRDEGDQWVVVDDWTYEASELEPAAIESAFLKLLQ
jgi:hypothetical protein